MASDEKTVVEPESAELPSDSVVIIGPDRGMPVDNSEGFAGHISIRLSPAHKSINGRWQQSHAAYEIDLAPRYLRGKTKVVR
jgi:hypothetical protein